MSEGVEETTSVYAEEGTQAHELAEYCLSTGIKDAFSADAREHVHWSHETAEAVQVYLDTVWEAASAKGATLEVETRFHLTAIDPDAFGTNDAMVYDPAKGKLTIIDYKHGAGVAVDVEGNKQLLYYALGAATRKHNLPLREIEMVIVQPRASHGDGPVRRWTVDPADLLEWSGDLKAAIAATRDPDAPLVAGTHCRWCPAKGFCPAFRDQAIEAARLDFAEPGHMSPAELADMLEQADVIEAWLKAVREYAYGRAMAGEPPSGFKLVAKRATRKWANEGEVIKWLKRRGLRDDDIFEMKVRSPAQVEKQIDKDERPDLEQFVIKESSGLTLVPERDRREAVTPGAASDFDAVSG